MQSDTGNNDPILNLDEKRVLASIFWVFGAVFSLDTALESYQRDKQLQTATISQSTQSDNLDDLKNQIAKMENQLQLLKEKIDT